MQRNRLFLALPAVAALLLTACSADEPMLLSDGEGVTFTAQLPQGLATRFGEGQAVDQLKYAVFHSSNSETSIINSDSEEAPQATRVGDDFKLTLPLLPNETYSIVFWAQSSQSDAFSFDPATGTVKVLYSNMEMNSDDHDVFFAGREHRVGLDKTEITLTRPLAQINIGTDDLAAAKALGAEHANTDIAIAGVHNLLDLKTGIVSKTDDFDGKVTFTAVEPLEAEFPVKHADENKSYKFMAMGYVLTGSEEAAARADESPVDGALTNIDLTFNYTDANRLPTLRSIPSVPIRRNHRTNLHGSLITTTTDWTVSIDAGFASGEDINHKYVEPWDGETIEIPNISEEGTAEVSTAAEFVGLAEALNTGELTADEVKEIQLEKDIDFGNNVFEGFHRQGLTEMYEHGNYPKKEKKVIFDGQGYTMRNITIPTHNYACALFSNLANGSVVKNLVVENIIIDGKKLGNIFGAIAGYSNGATFENITVRNSHIHVKGKAGAIVGYCANNATTIFRNCVVENVEFTGDQLMAGIVGYVSEPHKVVFENCPEPIVKFNLVSKDIPLKVNSEDLVVPGNEHATKDLLIPPTFTNADYDCWIPEENVMCMDPACALWYNFSFDDDLHGEVYYYFEYNGVQMQGLVQDFPVNTPTPWEEFFTPIPTDKRGRK